jgi:Protein of unknown function (DUF2946)
MGALRRHRTVVAWIAIVALLCNVATGLFAPAFGQRSASDWPADLLGPAVICSEHGDRATAPDDGRTPDPARHCLMCVVAPVFALLVALAATFLLAPPANRGPVALRLRDVLADRLRRSGLGSRAPPLPA